MNAPRSRSAPSISDSVPPIAHPPSLPANDVQDLKSFLAHRNPRTTDQRFPPRDKLKDPVIAPIVRGHFVSRIDRIAGGAPSGFEGFKKWIPIAGSCSKHLVAFSNHTDSPVDCNLARRTPSREAPPIHSHAVKIGNFELLIGKLEKLSTSLRYSRATLRSFRSTV